jgi:hypothetical protein
MSDERKPGRECIRRGCCIFTLGASRCTMCGWDRYAAVSDE